MKIEIEIGSKKGLCHNLMVQYLLALMKESTEDNLETKQNDFWVGYNKVFEAFKNKIDELER